jgi:hypothetical protein
MIELEAIILCVGLTSAAGSTALILLSNWLESEVTAFRQVIGFACGGALMTALCTAFFVTATL